MSTFSLIHTFKSMGAKQNIFVYISVSQHSKQVDKNDKDIVASIAIITYNVHRNKQNYDNINDIFIYNSGSVIMHINNNSHY